MAKTKTIIAPIDIVPGRDKEAVPAGTKITLPMEDADRLISLHGAVEADADDATVSLLEPEGDPRKLLADKKPGRPEGLLKDGAGDENREVKSADPKDKAPKDEQPKG